MTTTTIITTTTTTKIYLLYKVASQVVKLYCIKVVFEPIKNHVSFELDLLCLLSIFSQANS